MAFNPVDQSFPRNRKTLRLASRLRIKPSEVSGRHQVMGHLVTFWLWALDNASPAGRLTGVTEEELAAAAEWNGDAHRFVSALLDCGFVERDMDSTDIFIHDWSEYGGKLVRERMSERVRSQIRRDQQRGRSTAERPPVDRQTTGDRPVAEKSREEKSRVEQRREDPAAAAAAHTDGDEAVSELDEAVARLCRGWEHATGTTVTRLMAEGFEDWLTKLPEAALVKAIAETGAGGAKSWRYCEAVLRRYEVEGWEPREAEEDDLEARKRKYLGPVARLHAQANERGVA